MRQLPAPWSAEKTEGGYRVRDSLGRTLCYIYCRDDELNAEVAKVLTWEEGRRVAANIASAGASKAMTRSLMPASLFGVLAVGALCVLLVIYLASPLIAIHRIESAVRTKDAVSLTERIVFPALRRSLTKQIVGEYLKLTGKKLPLHAMGKRLAISVADPVVARLMTVRAMLDLLGKGDAGEKAKVPVERAPFTSTSFESLWQVWLNCDYRGRSFYVHLPPKKPRAEQFRAQLRLINWQWRIVGLDLPEDLKEHLAKELVKLTNELLPDTNL